MNPTRKILVASKEQETLEKIIQLQPHIELDILAPNKSLCDQLTRQPYNLLVVDLAILNSTPPCINQFPNTAVLLLVSLDERSQAVAQLQQNVIDYALLPINPTELNHKVNRILHPESTRTTTALDGLLTLNQATQEIIQTLQLDKAMNILLSRVHQMASIDVAKIWLGDKNGNLQQGESLAQISIPTYTAKENSLLFSLAQKSAFSQQVILQQKTPDTLWQKQSMESVLIIPMVTGERLIGVLALGSIRPSAFSGNLTRLLSVFCDQAAIALENARLFHDLSTAYIDLAQSREEILQRRNTLQVVFDGIADGLYILDHDLTINTLNRIEAERQGYTSDELVGRNYLSLKGVNSAPQLTKQIEEALKTGQETTWISSEKDDEPYLKDREFRIYPICNRLGQIEQIVIFAQDVSERRRWQASLFRSANLAAVGQLAGSVAHQINNPLTVTMTNSQLLLLDILPNTEAHDLTTGIFKAGERIQNTVANLLEFSNQEEYFFVETDLIDSIEGALSLVIRSLKKAQIQLVKDYQVQPMLVASVSHLKLVWVNLLQNARDAVAGFADTPQITITTQSVSDREVKVCITDNGVGITEKQKEQIFTPFFTTRPAGKALGLGLYSARTIIDRHRGQINVSSQPGVATTFEIILPLDNPKDL